MMRIILIIILYLYSLSGVCASCSALGGGRDISTIEVISSTVSSKSESFLENPPLSLTLYKDSLLSFKDAVKAGERIINGCEAGGLFPEVAKISISGKAGPTICSGVFIDKDKILTAAHCLCVDNQIISNQIVDISTVGFKTNSVIKEIKNYSLDMKRTMSVNIIKCGDKNIINKDIERDIGIIFLKRNSEFFSYKIKPLIDSDTLKVFDAKINKNQATIVGYGYNNKDLNKSYGLKFFADIPVLDSTASTCDECNKGNEMILAHIFNNQSNTGACFGDSGGPMYIRTETGAEFIAGINSRLRGSDCIAGNIYSRIDTRVLSWIRSF